MCPAGETACATNDKSFACIGGAGFSLPTPACGRILSRTLTFGALLGTAAHHAEPRAFSDRVFAGT
jgi:hypothetical protein